MRSLPPNHLRLLTRSVDSATGNGGSQLSPRRWSFGFGGLNRPPFHIGVAIAALLAFGACSSAGSGESTTTESAPLTTSSIEATTTSSASASTTTSTTIAEATTTLPSDQNVIEAWASYWDAWAEVRASENLDPAPLAAVASSDVVEGAIALFERQRSSGLDAVQTDVVLHATVTSVDSSRATIVDCVLLAPSFTDTTGVWYEADLTRSGEGWLVDAVRIPTIGGCVPQTMAEEAIAAYESYYDALAEFWDPPDPQHPLISDVLAEPRLSNVIGLLEEHEERGVAFRSRPINHPEVIEVRSPTEIVILDCYEPDSADGLYDLATGNRLPDEPPITEGQRNLRSVVMVLQEGKWKSSDFQGQVDFACEFAPTERGLPSV